MVSNFYIEDDNHEPDSRMKRCLLLICLAVTGIAPLWPQELDCKFSVDTRAISAEAKAGLEDFEAQLSQYMNPYRWTREDLNGEKIRCSFDIRITGSPRENSFSAQVFIGSSRPIYKLDGRSTAVTRILDDKWDFPYIKYQTMNHDESRFDPLMSFLDFYAHVILGYDFDTYKPGDGSPYFQKASEIVNKARNSPGAGKGWDESSQGTYSRNQLIDELLNPKFYDFREAIFRYHYRGLDLLHKDEAKARKNVLSALEKIANLQKKINQNSLAIRSFFDTKYLEIAEMFSKDPDLTIFSRLTKIDPTHQKNYDEYSKRAK